MPQDPNRRDWMKLMGLGGVMYASHFWGCTTPRGAGGESPRAGREDFAFMQLSDTHWGYTGASNPEADTTLPLDAKPVGGLGLFMIRKSVDELSYRRVDDRNLLTMKKRVP